MLKTIRIKNIGLITALHAEFGEGLNIITGETGAGKSMVLSALNLVLGGRADSEVLRQGTDSAIAEAAFDARRIKTATAAFEALGILPEEGELLVRRTLQKEGKNRALVNGSPIGLSDLKSAGESMVDIHGQHDHQSLLNRETHLTWLDGYLSLESAREEVAAIVAEARGLENALHEIAAKQSAATAQREFLQFKADELEKSELKENEEALLEAEHKRLASSEKIRETGAQVFADLYESDASAISRLEHAAKEMERLKSADPFFAGHAALFSELAERLSDSAREISAFCAGVEDDPARMHEVETRLALLEKLKRKYRSDMPGLIKMREEVRRELDSMESAGEEREKMEKALNVARTRLLEKASALHKKRVKGVAAFKKDVQKELSDLNMAGARFEVEVTLETAPGSGLPLDGEPRKIYPHGFGLFQFLISTNEGQEPRPLAKIASGGEISRIMLGLKGAIGKVQPVPVLVFDEIDVGIGGKTADMVGEKLKKLAKNCQIICITHLAQIARQADHHFVVEKKTVGGQTEVNISRLDENGRIEELARMGAGKVITDAAREHAKEMMGK